MINYCKLKNYDQIWTQVHYDNLVNIVIELKAGFKIKGHVEGSRNFPGWYELVLKLKN